MDIEEILPIKASFPLCGISSKEEEKFIEHLSMLRKEIDVIACSVNAYLTNKKKYFPE